MTTWGGFTIEAPFPMPRLGDGNRHDDNEETIVVRFGRLPNATPVKDLTFTPPDGNPVHLQVGAFDNGLVFRPTDCSAFAVNNHEVVIEQEHDPWRLEHYIVNTALPIACGLRGQICLHASAIERNHEAVVISGPTGAGKSTYAYRNVKDGWRLLGDDTAVIRDGVCYPTVGSVRIIGLEEGRENRGKMEVRLPAGDAAPLRSILLLEPQRTTTEEADAKDVLPSLCRAQAVWAYADAALRSTLLEKVECLNVPVRRVGRETPAEF